MKTIKKNPSEVKAGDKILPPAREMNLWMKKSCLEKGLALEALFLSVTEVVPSARRDKGGDWTRVSATYSQEFGQGRSIRFFVRPNTSLMQAAA